MYQEVFNNIVNKPDTDEKVYEFIFASLFFLKHFKGSQYCEKLIK